MGSCSIAWMVALIAETPVIITDMGQDVSPTWVFHKGIPGSCFR